MIPIIKEIINLIAYIFPASSRDVYMSLGWIVEYQAGLREVVTYKQVW